MNSRKWITKRAKPMGIIMNNLAELEDLQEQLQLSFSLGIKKLII